MICFAWLSELNNVENTVFFAYRPCYGWIVRFPDNSAR